MGLIVEDKTIVIPGEEVAEGMDFLPAAGTYREGDKIIASKVGLLNVDGRLIKLIPMSGRYMPKRNDVIIGKVIDISMSGWRIELNSAYTAMLNVKDATSEFIGRGEDLTQFYAIGDYVVAKVINVTSQKLVDLATKGPGLRRIRGGRIISVAPTKVPRIIGKSGSMVGMIKDATGTKITVGQNGLVWIQGEPEKEILVVNTIRKIETESHVSGLTDVIKAYLISLGLEVRNEQSQPVEFENQQQ
ncbi:MAG: exosome complex RNA-binding protein Rrp4 [Nanoarchaeota archaeon]|nr:exosome complex RNA-binding protein Rrp4 [Nanoarchaeota archaeon]